MSNLRERLEALEKVFAHYEQALTFEQGQVAICLMRKIVDTLEHLPRGGGNPFIEAALAKVNGDGKRPVMFVDWMNAFYQAQNYASDALLQCIAYAPHCTSQEYADLRKRRTLVEMLKRLARVMAQIPAFAPIAERTRQAPEYLQVLPETGGEEHEVS